MRDALSAVIIRSGDRGGLFASLAEQPHAADGHDQAGKLGLPAGRGFCEHAAQMRLDGVRRKIEQLCELGDGVAGRGLTAAEAKVALAAPT
jgi:hypothetical protein